MSNSWKSGKFDVGDHADQRGEHLASLEANSSHDPDDCIVQQKRPSRPLVASPHLPQRAAHVDDSRSDASTPGKRMHPSEDEVNESSLQETIRRTAENFNKLATSESQVQSELVDVVDYETLHVFALNAVDDLQWQLLVRMKGIMWRTKTILRITTSTAENAIEIRKQFSDAQCKKVLSINSATLINTFADMRQTI